MIYWIIYCILDGINEAHFYHFKQPTKKVKINEHAFKLITRVLIGFIITNDNLYYLISFALAQPFIMNNTYYNFRHYLDKRVYKYSLDNQSETSTAKTTKLFTPEVRTILFIFSLWSYYIISTQG